MFEPSGFFALRTPLLPFDEVRAWSDGLQAPIAEAEGKPELALTSDRAVLTERLVDAWQRPEVREAVYLASPELHAALERSAASGVGTARGRSSNDKTLRGLVAYFSRMAARSTPFGLFAGCSVGSFGPCTRLDLPPRTKYTRHTRLDMDLLSALVAALEADPAVRQRLRYRPNSSLYRAGGRLHYAESRLRNGVRSYHLIALEESPELSDTLDRAADGARLDDLATVLVDAEIGPDEARQFLDELVASQVLVSELGPPVTGDEAIHDLIARLGSGPVAVRLEQVRDRLTCIDRDGVGGSTPGTYANLRAHVDALPVKAEPARLFQVDMVKPADGLSLGTAVRAELARGLNLLQRLPPPIDREVAALRTFAERFVARYEEAEVPLVEALDEEIGIGFQTGTEPGGEPLLQGLDRPASAPEPRDWRVEDDVRLRLLTDAVRHGEQTIELRPADLDALASLEPRAPLPDALAILARLAAPSAEAVDRGDFRLLLQGASGPSGARLLGRFCHADPELHRRVVEHLRAEEAHHPEAVFAEIVHLPEGRLGNILSRPVLRDYEIPFLGQSGAAADRQISVNDLHVSVRRGQIVVRSAGLDREVVPRLTTAHNYGLRSLGLYRFLCALQHQGTTAALGWSWGPLDMAPFLPRVQCGRLVLARACWTLTASEFGPLVQAQGAAQFSAMQALRAARGLPRYVALADADNELVVDLDNVLSVEGLLHLVKSREAARLVELFPAPDELCVTGPEGRFVSELVVPFVRAPVSPAPSPAGRPSNVQRRFAPGSEWLYAKLYTGHAVADRLLVDVIRPVVQDALGSGVADGWFFIRYADPEPHLRLRLHGDPKRLTGEVLPALAARLESPVENGQIARWQLDTYVREVERYGGDQGIRLAERLFDIDSTCVLSMLASVPGDEGLAWRWKLGLYGVDLLLDALGFDLDVKRDWARERRDAFAREFRADGRLKQQLGEKYRAERQGVDELLRLARSAEAVQYPALQALHDRSTALGPIAQELRALHRAGRLTVSLRELAASYAHMHVNRSLRSAHRFQELVIYELLDRLYRAQGARS